MRASNPGADAAAAAQAFEVAAAAPLAAAVAPAMAGICGCAGFCGCADDAFDAASIGWPQLPQKRALAGTGLLHLGQFTMFSLFVDPFMRTRCAHRTRHGGFTGTPRLLLAWKIHAGRRYESVLYELRN
jgi:hypothetical protein